MSPFRFVADGDHRYRIEGDGGVLLGIISSKNAEGPWRVELKMKIDAQVGSKTDAFAFVRGCEATMKAYGIVPKQ